MDSKTLVNTWFKKWEEGDFYNLPITENFEHTSPFGTISGRQNYIDLVEKNKDKFLGYQFNIHDEIYAKNNACVRYTAVQGNFNLDVSEWYYIKNGLIDKIMAYYHIGDTRGEKA